MMGRKERAFGPLAAVSLDDLVPADDFYRHLDRCLDRGFVRDLVRDASAAGGRPSIDPVVFFKPQLVMFFEAIRSERRLVRVAADRLSVRWYLGYGLGEPLPDHPRLTRIRDRYGLDVLRRFFEAVVERRIAAGLVRGAEHASTPPRSRPTPGATRSGRASPSRRTSPTRLPPGRGTPAGAKAGTRTRGARRSRCRWRCRRTRRARWPRPPRPATTGSAGPAAPAGAWCAAPAGARPTSAPAPPIAQRAPDAAFMRLRGGGLDLGDHDHDAVDGGRARVVLAALVTPADVMED